jgi:UDP-glucose 4-epimerase
MGEDYSLRDVATIIARKYKAEISYMEWPDEQRRIESGHTVFCAEKLKKSFDIDIRYSLTEWVDGVNIS